MDEAWISVHREEGIEFAVSALHPGAYPEHIHTTVELLLQLHAPALAFIRDWPILLRPGDLIAILPNEAHSRTSSPLTQFAALEIDAAELRRLTGVELPASLAPGDPVRLWRGAFSPAEVRGLERAIREDLAGVTVGLRRLVLERALGHPLLRPRVRAPGRAGLPQELLQQARDALDCSGDLERLRHSSGFSEHHFISAFRRSFGLPPHQVLLGRRLDRARTAVITTSSRLVEIAADHGFYDQSHLCRLFKRAYAVSPVVYRRIVRVHTSPQHVSV